MFVRITTDRRPQPNTLDEFGLAGTFNRIIGLSEFKYRKDTEIFGEKEPAVYVYQVKHGAVRSYKLLSDGRRQIAVTYKSAIDDPHRIVKSKAAGALFGITPKKYQSGEKDVTGGITLAGDEIVRTVLYEAANVLLSRITRFSKLKRWGMDVAKRRGSKRAKVALARKLAVILHRIWVDGTTYRWTEAGPIAA
jgi:hypothetical protein